MSQYTGQCLCGSCCYIITGEKPEAMYLCHCRRCRKETGTTHGTNAFFSNAQLLWKKGEKNITKNKRKAPGFIRGLYACFW